MFEHLPENSFLRRKKQDLIDLVDELEQRSREAYQNLLCPYVVGYLTFQWIHFSDFLAVGSSVLAQGFSIYIELIRDLNSRTRIAEPDEKSRF